MAQRRHATWPGAAGAFAVVCAPFLLAAPWNAVRYTVFDQLGRPNTGIGLSERLPPSRRFACGGPAARCVFVSWRRRRGWWDLRRCVGAALVIVTGYRSRGHGLGRSWRASKRCSSSITPSFFGDYATFPAPAASLVIGMGLAAIVAPLLRRGVPPIGVRRAVVHVWPSASWPCS